MSGEKNVRYEQTAAYRRQQEARVRNRRNKQRARQLMRELEDTIKENKKRGADRLAKKELEQAERLHQTLAENVKSKNDNENNYTGVVNQESAIKKACDALENTVVEQMEKEREWTAPLKKAFELGRKVGSGTSRDDKDDLIVKWKQDELEAISSQLKTLRDSIEDKSGEPEKIYYQLRDMEQAYDQMMTEATSLEEKSIAREMLVETIESALKSPEMQFKVRVSSVEPGNPYAQVILDAWRPGDETIQMRFDLDNTGKRIETFASGFAGPEYPGGCDSAYDTLAHQLASTGLSIRTFQDGRELGPPPDEVAINARRRIDKSHGTGK